MNSVSKLRLIAVLGFVLFVAKFVHAQADSKTAAPSKPADMNGYWDKLLQDVVPVTPPDPALTTAQEPVRRREAGDFLNHFFLESRTEYTRQEISFSGHPTN